MENGEGLDSTKSFDIDAAVLYRTAVRLDWELMVEELYAARQKKVGIPVNSYLISPHKQLPFVVIVSVRLRIVQFS